MCQVTSLSQDIFKENKNQFTNLCWTWISQIETKLMKSLFILTSSSCRFSIPNANFTFSSRIERSEWQNCMQQLRWNVLLNRNLFFPGRKTFLIPTFLANRLVYTLEASRLKENYRLKHDQFISVWKSNIILSKVKFFVRWQSPMWYVSTVFLREWQRRDFVHFARETKIVVPGLSIRNVYFLLLFVWNPRFM